MKLRELFVEIGVEVDDADLEVLDTGIQELAGHVRKLGAIALGAASGVAAFLGGLGALAVQQSELAEEFVRVSETMDITSASYQTLRFQFQALNASSDDLHDVLLNLNGEILEAARGNKTAQQKLKNLGLTAKELIDLPLDEKFRAVTESARAMGDSSAAASHIMLLLGEDVGRRIAPGLLSASGAMERYSRIAEHSGIIIEDHLLRKGLEAQMMFRAFGAVVTGIMRRIGVTAAPAFGRLAGHFTNFAIVLNRWVVPAIENFGTFLEEEFEKVAGYFDLLDGWVQKAGGWGNVLVPLIGAFLALGAVITGASIRGALLSLGPILTKVFSVGLAGLAPFLAKALALAAVFVAIALVVEDIIGYFSGAESSIGRFIERAKSSGGFIAKMGEAFRRVMAGMGKIFNEIAKLWNTIIERLKVAFSLMAGPLKKAFMALVVVVVALIGFVALIVVGVLLVVWAAIELWIILQKIQQWIGELIYNSIMELVDAFKGLYDWATSLGDKFASWYETVKKVLSTIKEAANLDILDSAKNIPLVGRFFGDDEPENAPAQNVVQNTAQTAAGRTRTERRGITRNQTNNITVEGSEVRIEGGTAEQGQRLAKVLNKNSEDQAQRLSSTLEE